MSILLLVLKIIGITLLAILGLILFLVIVLLFVPFRYSLDADKPDAGDFTAAAKVTWLLHFVNVKVSYDSELKILARVSLIPVYKSENLKTEKEKKKAEEKEKKKKLKEEKKLEKERLKREKDLKKSSKKKADDKSDSTSSSDNDNGLNTDIESKALDQSSDTAKKDQVDSVLSADADDDSTEEKLSLIERIFFVFEKIFGFFGNIRDSICKVLLKIKDIWDNIEFYIDFIEDERNKEAFAVLLDQVKRILKSIAPRKIRGKVHYESTDPCTYGKMMSIYGILLPIIRDKIQVVTGTDTDSLAGNIIIKGKITLFVLAKAAYIYFFNKDVKRMRKMLKRR